MKFRFSLVYFLFIFSVSPLYLTSFSYESYRTAGDGMRYQIAKRWASEYHDPEQLFLIPEKILRDSAEKLKNCIDSKLKIKKNMKMARKRGLKPTVLQCLHILKEKNSEK